MGKPSEDKTIPLYQKKDKIPELRLPKVKGKTRPFKGGEILGNLNFPGKWTWKRGWKK